MWLSPFCWYCLALCAEYSSPHFVGTALLTIGECGYLQFADIALYTTGKCGSPHFVGIALNASGVIFFNITL